MRVDRSDGLGLHSPIPRVKNIREISSRLRYIGSHEHVSNKYAAEIIFDAEIRTRGT